jgi:hypothetical protein
VTAAQLALLAELRAPASIRRRLYSPAAFTLGPITREEWEWLVGLGWISDGSSRSLDNIEGIRIGRSGTDYADAPYPANRHDFWYELGRLFRLGSAFKLAADRDYRDCCIVSLRLNLVGLNMRKGVARAHVRYYALRAFGRGAWTAEPQVTRREQPSAAA